MEMTSEEIEAAAEQFAQTVSTSRRVTADLYLGSDSYNTVTAIVKAAFIAGAKAANSKMSNSSI